MLWYIIPTTIIIISAVVLIFVALKKIPQLRVMDVSTTPEQKAKEIKEKIILQRIERIFGAKFGLLRGYKNKAVYFLSGQWGVVTKKLKDLEKYYEQLKHESPSVRSFDPEAVRKILSSAEDLLRVKQYSEAERKLIEVISNDPKNIDAYEILGNLYIQTRQIEQAKETFKFILKIKPKDASVLTSLGEIALEDNNPKEALVYLSQAIKNRPNNPKYLNFYIIAALSAGDRISARKGIDQLREVNPENAKLEQFENELQEL